MHTLPRLVVVDIHHTILETVQVLYIYNIENLAINSVILATHEPLKLVTTNPYYGLLSYVQWQHLVHIQLLYHK